MCTFVEPKQEFYLLCRSEWAVHPGREYGAQTFINEGLERALFFRNHPGLKQTPRKFVQLTLAHPIAEHSAEFAARREATVLDRMSPLDQEKYLQRLILSRTPIEQYDELLLEDQAE